MTSLREKKKEKTRKEIQMAALKLFERLGYEKTTMEKIASETEIGVGTLYNYFPSKVDLLFSIIEGNLEVYLSELEEIINSELTLQESLREFFNVYLRSFTTYGKNIWRDLFREVLFREHKGKGKIKEIDQNFIDQLYQLLCKHFMEKGINKQERLSAASRAMYSLLGYHIICFVSDNSVSSQEMIEALMEETNIIVDGLCATMMVG